MKKTNDHAELTKVERLKKQNKKSNCGQYYVTLYHRFVTRYKGNHTNLQDDLKTMKDV